MDLKKAIQTIFREIDLEYERIENNSLSKSQDFRKWDYLVELMWMCFPEEVGDLEDNYGSYL